MPCWWCGTAGWSMSATSPARTSAGASRSAHIPHDAETKHDLRSITKSVTSLLVGIAVDYGWIKDIDAPVLSLLPQYADLRSPRPTASPCATC